MTDAATVLSDRIVAFFALTYLLTWSAWGAVLVVGTTSPLASVLMLLGGFGPLLAAAVLAWRDRSLREWAARAVRWRVSARWWLAALALPVVLSLVGYALYAAVTGASVTPTSGPVSLLYLTVFLSVFFLRGGFGEEMGWRGYALPRLLERYSALTAGLVVGVLWAGWHLPLFLVQGARQSGSFALYLLGVVGLSVVLTWLFVNASESVLLVVVFHAQWNVLDSGVLFDVRGPTGLWAPAASAAVVWALALALVAAYGTDLRADRTRPERGAPVTGPAGGGAGRGR